MGTFSLYRAWDPFHYIEHGILFIIQSMGSFSLYRAQDPLGSSEPQVMGILTGLSFFLISCSYSIQRIGSLSIPTCLSISRFYSMFRFFISIYVLVSWSILVVLSCLQFLFLLSCSCSYSICPLSYCLLCNPLQCARIGSDCLNWGSLSGFKDLILIQMKF